MTEDNRDYLQKIEDLLDNYVDGRDVFKKAPDWNYPLALKPHAEGNSGIPDNWMDLAKEVIEILGRDKYGLDFLEKSDPDRQQQADDDRHGQRPADASL